MARMVVNRTETDDGPDVMRWADRMLIRLVSKIFFNNKTNLIKYFKLSVYFYVNIVTDSYEYI